MLQEDYLFRPLYMMIDEITSKFSAIKVERIKSLETYLDNLYLDYINGNRNYFIEKDVTEILGDNHLTEKQINLLAELFYRDALIQEDKSLKKLLLQKANIIFKYISNKSDTYSFEIATKIDSIEKMINKLL